jgi:mRNA interferase RelE/StbE
VAYRVEILAAAQRDIRALRKPDQRRVVDVIEALGSDPRPQGCKKLRGLESLYRIRLGQYRIIYTVSDTKTVVLALRVRHCRDVYDHLQDLNRHVRDIQALLDKTLDQP